MYLEEEKVRSTFAAIRRTAPAGHLIFTFMETEKGIVTFGNILCEASFGSEELQRAPSPPPLSSRP